MIKKKKLCDLVNFKILLECKKAKDKHVRDYDYLGRYDGCYHDGDYYKRRGNYDEGSRFTPRLDIP